MEKTTADKVIDFIRTRYLMLNQFQQFEELNMSTVCHEFWGLIIVLKMNKETYQILYKTKQLYIIGDIIESDELFQLLYNCFGKIKQIEIN